MVCFANSGLKVRTNMQYRMLVRAFIRHSFCRNTRDCGQASGFQTASIACGGIPRSDGSFRLVPISKEGRCYLLLAVGQKLISQGVKEKQRGQIYPTRTPDTGNTQTAGKDGHFDMLTITRGESPSINPARGPQNEDWRT